LNWTDVTFGGGSPYYLSKGVIMTVTINYTNQDQVLIDPQYYALAKGIQTTQEPFKPLPISKDAKDVTDFSKHMGRVIKGHKTTLPPDKKLLKTTIVIFMGKAYSLQELAAHFGIKLETIRSRILQASSDQTMEWIILSMRRGGGIFLNYNGTTESDEWWATRPEIKTLNLTYLMIRARAFKGWTAEACLTIPYHKKESTAKELKGYAAAEAKAISKQEEAVKALAALDGKNLASPAELPLELPEGEASSSLVPGGNMHIKNVKGSPVMEESELAKNQEAAKSIASATPVPATVPATVPAPIDEATPPSIGGTMTYTGGTMTYTADYQGVGILCRSVPCSRPIITP
jgi:hypothetical protein